MKLAVEFPSVAYREGPAGVARLAKAIESIGFDQLDIFDHVVMGYPVEGRAGSPYPAQMPILEALASLAYFAAVTETVGLGTEVLVLPQRHPTLVAKQVATLDTLSAGRVRLGVGVGWQEAEYEALGFDFHRRGAMMDEAIPLLRKLWGDERIDHDGEFYRLEAIACEPKPPQGAGLPIWVGGHSDVALRRAGRLGDGWLAVLSAADTAKAAEDIRTVKRHAAEAGRDPDAMGFQSQIAPPPRPDSDTDKNFYGDDERVGAVAAGLQDAGFDWLTVNATSVFLAGARSLDALIDRLDGLHGYLRQRLS